MPSKEEYRKGPPAVAAKLIAAGWVYDEGAYHLGRPSHISVTRIVGAVPNQGYWRVWDGQTTTQCVKAPQHLGRYLQTTYGAGW